MTAGDSACTVAGVEGYSAGDPAIGQELRDFFLELLEAKNLQAYHEDRKEYVRRRAVAGESGDAKQYLSDEAQRLLQSPDLRAIEQHIMAITGSKALPLWVVAPPYA